MTSDLEPCTVCGRACYRAVPGGRWRVEWQVGENPREQQLVGGDLTECRAAAHAPSSPLPGSFKRLVEEYDGKERVWLHVDARNFATIRMNFLRDAHDALLVSEALLSAPKVWSRLIGTHRAYLHEMRSSLLAQTILALEPLLWTYQAAVLELATLHAQRARDGANDAAIAEKYRTTRTTERRLKARLFDIAGLIRAEAQTLATGWLQPEPAIGRAFESLARTCALRARRSRRRAVTVARGVRRRRAPSK